ncbi:MAG: hypothetical protein KDK53_06370 [Maritimibacter sp.]|nr:hypothetical protein [Maritimibacter sp.]
METRVYDGHLVVDGQESGKLRLKVLLSTDYGMVSGTGGFDLPLALVGITEGSAVRFRTERGETITLLLSEIDPAEGRAYFLTLGALPKDTAVRRAG